MQNLVAAKLRKLRLPLRYEPGAAPLQLDGEAYRGALVVHRQAGKLTIVNRLPLDRYLRGVVPWEMPDDWHREALRAQSVVARSYALATLKPGKLFDLYADTRSQVYGGIRAEADTTNRAIGSTAGQVVSWQGRVATTFYHSTSGGRTVSNAEAWPGASPVPYLVSVADPLRRALEAPPLGTVRADSGRGRERGSASRACVTSSSTRGPAGRATEVTIEGRAVCATMSAQDFRRALDLRSTWFAVRVLHLEQPRRARTREREPAGRARAASSAGSQGAARTAGERRHVDNRPTCAAARGRALHGHGRPAGGRRATGSRITSRRRGCHRKSALRRF